MFAPRYFAPRYFPPEYWPPDFSVGETTPGGGRKRAKRTRWRLPDGRLFYDQKEAYEALQAYLEARFQREIASSRIKRRGVKIKKREAEERVAEGLEQATLLLREIPLPDVLERLPAPVKAKMDPELIQLASELAALNQEEDEIITLLFLM